MPNIRYTQNENVDEGTLRVQVVARGTNNPIQNARIQISSSSEPEQTLEEVNTNVSGMSDQVTLNTPPLEYSMEPSENQPFSQYDIRVTAEGFRPFTVSGIQLFSEQLAIQPIRMEAENAPGTPIDDVVIPPNTLFGDFPPKIAESEIKPLAESGEIVLSRVVIPEFVVVHDGPPADLAARNYYVRYRE